MTALLTPYVQGNATRANGKRLWRKQLLPVGDIVYKGRRVHFTRSYLTDLASAFNDSAYDQVPFQLAPGGNEHTNDPERFRGEVRRFEMTPDGLDIVVAATKAGDAVLRENPRLGISARIVEGLQRADGKFWPRAVQHVLGTLDPRITGMGPWQAIEASNAGHAGTTIDLTEAEFVGADDEPAGTENTDMPGLNLNDEQTARLTALLSLPQDQFDRLMSGQNPDDPSDEELEALLAQIEAQEGSDPEDEDEDENGEDPEPLLAGATAELSAQAARQLQLANSALSENAEAMRLMREEIDRDRWGGPSGEREQLIRLSHLPPAVIDLAAPLLIGTGRTVELSGGETIDAGAIMRRVFVEIGKNAKMLDLGPEIGQGFPVDLSAEDESTRAAERDDLVSAMLNGNFGLR